MKYSTKRNGIQKIVDWFYCFLGALMYALVGTAIILLLIMVQWLLWVIV